MMKIDYEIIIEIIEIVILDNSSEFGFNNQTYTRCSKNMETLIRYSWSNFK